MKKLTKIKLVNWHAFSNMTIPVEGNTLVSGENGSGKSTLLDALQYLLVGGRSGVKFNIAANDEARRSLEGYIRGRIGAENKEFLRNGDCITHVALEFYDEVNEQFGVVGCILELPKGGSLKERFYLFEDLELHDNMFVEGKYPRDYRSMKAYMKTLDLELQILESQRKYRDALARFFGLDARKYARILPKALAFRPIDLQNFVFEFLLDDDPIDIQSLKNNVAQLKRVETQIRLDREKLEHLTKIIDAGSKLQDQRDQIQINQLISSMSLISSREALVRKLENDVEVYEKKIIDLRHNRSDIDQKLSHIEEQILEFEKAKVLDDQSQVLLNYQKQHEQLTHQHEQLKEEVRSLKEVLDNEVKIYNSIVEIVDSPQLSAFIKYYLKNSNQLDVNSAKNYLSGALSTIEGLQHQLAVEKTKNEESRIDLADKMNALENQLRQLRRDSKPYPYNVEKLIETLKERLSNLYQKQIAVQPLAELIEVNDEHWRNALEGYLGNQRYDIIIDPLYFNDALQIYEQVKQELKIYGVGLVNTNKLGEYDTYQENSLASKLDSDFKYARNYANMLLGNVICVDNLEDLKMHRRSITATAMTYGNYTARAINPRVYEVPYIGRKANDLLVKRLSNEQMLVEKEMNSLFDIIERNNKLHRIISSSKINQIVHRDQLNILNEVVEQRRALIQLENKINELLDNPNVRKIEDKIDKLKEELRNTKMIQTSIIEQTSDIRSSQSHLVESIERNREEIEYYVNETKKLNQTKPSLYNNASIQYEAYLKRFDNNYDKINRAVTEDNLSINSQQSKQQAQVIQLMSSYISKYQFGAAPDLDELVEFQKEYGVIKNHNLVEYEQEAIQLRHDSEIGFREEFVNKLRASIEDAQQQIAELNLALDGKTFGKDSYKLITKPSEDPEFGNYYNIIMNSSNPVGNRELFTEGLTRKNELILMELFDKIASSDPEHDKLAHQLLDYRYYMTYDIEVLNENGNRLYFSKVSREKSGGETQVPFYIVIAASFQQLLTKNRKVDSGCIVLFDEAFNNMDDSRIDAMMKFYNSLSIQLVIAVPPQRVANIVNYVNTALAVVKHDDYAIVSHFNHDMDMR